MFSYQGSFLLFFSSDSFYILSKAFLFVKNFFNFFQSYLVAFQQQAYLYYHKLFRLSRIFSILFLCRFSRISLNSLSFSFSLVKNFFILFRHFSVVFQLVKIPFLNSVLNKRRRRDLNPRAATNDLLPFQGSPFGQLGYFSKSGEGGIRTHAPFRTNGFQDRLVMTASISLQTCFSIIQDKKRFVKSFFNLFFLVFSYFLAVHQQLSYNIMAGSICQHFFYIFSKTFSGSFSDPSKHSKMP